MAITAYCKKCNREVEPGEICPRCGTRLAKTAVHAAWVVERTPAADWMCWNAVMRWLLPAGTAVVLLALIIQGISGGPEAVESLFRGSFPLTLLLLFLAAAAGVAAVLLIRGKELLDCVVDSRGVHVTCYVPRPTALKLLARGKSPRLLDQVNWEAEAPVLRLEERDLPWRAVARVQLWPEKCYILFYAPAWWLRIPLRCTPFSWEDALFFVRDKLGKKKKVILPDHLRTPAAPKAASAGTPPRRTARAARIPEENEDPFPEERDAPPRRVPRAARVPEAENEDPFPEEPEAPAPGVPWEEEPAAEGEDPEAVPPSAGEQLSLDI